MKHYKKEILKLTAKEVLLSVFDLALPFFEAHRSYRVPARKYHEERDEERSAFLEKVRYLRRHGFIENLIEGKDKYIEITPKGIKKISEIKMNNLVLERPIDWDRKWRVVIFDIPKKHNLSRDILRTKMIKLGFQKIQESVYVYPFECTEIIENLASRLNIVDYVLIMISEIIQGEEEILEKFLDRGVLTKEDLKR